MEELKVDWSTAKVHGGRLTVSLSDKPTREWSASFERTVQLLNHGTWDAVKLKKKDVVEVDGLEPGGEESLRFFLESVIQEANAEVSDPEEPEASEGAEGSESEDADGNGQGDEDEPRPDDEMTERFRSFAG